jgi:hypothetical protein
VLFCSKLKNSSFGSLGPVTWAAGKLMCIQKYIAKPYRHDLTTKIGPPIIRNLEHPRVNMGLIDVLKPN